MTREEVLQIIAEARAKDEGVNLAYHMGSYWSHQEAYAAGRKGGYRAWKVIKDGSHATVQEMSHD